MAWPSENWPRMRYCGTTQVYVDRYIDGEGDYSGSRYLGLAFNSACRWAKEFNVLDTNYLKMLLFREFRVNKIGLIISNANI